MPLAGKWGASQYAQFTLETAAAWATFNGSATIKPWVELEPGALDIDRKVQTKDSKVASANIPGRRVGSRYDVMGTYKTKLFPELMVPFLDWACKPAIVSGRMSLPSYTIDWFDGLEPRRFRGVRVEEATFEFGADGQWGMGTFKLRGRDQDTTPPTLVEPAVTAYPIVNPAILLDTAGNCTFNGSVITGYRSLKVTVKNILDPQFDEFNVLNSLAYCGREVTADFVVKNNTTTNKLLYEAQTANAALFKWIETIAGPHTYTTTFDFQGSVYQEHRTVSRDFDKDQYETISFKAFRDATSGLDLVASSVYV